MELMEQAEKVLKTLVDIYEKIYMGNKKEIIPVIIVLVFMTIAILYQNRKARNFSKTVSEIVNIDSLNITVNLIIFNRGLLIFDNKYYVDNSMNSFDELREIWYLETPVQLIKESRNDTIKLLSNDTVKYLIIDTKKDSTEYFGDMSIMEFIKKHLLKE